MDVTKRAKRIQKLFTSPKTVTFEELDTVLRDLGCLRRNRGSSHFVYTKNERHIVIPHHRPYIKENYVKRVSEMIEEMSEYEKES